MRSCILLLILSACISCSAFSAQTDKTDINKADINKTKSPDNYKVGITQLDLRPTQHSNQPKLHLHIWYPSQISSNQKDYETTPALRNALAKAYKIPRFVISTKSITHATVNPVIADGKWPVIFFSHGFNAFARQNNRMMETLASNGYIVIAISNPQDSLVTEYNDGTIIQVDENEPAHKFIASLKRKDIDIIGLRMQNELNAIRAANNYIDYAQALKNLGEDNYFSRYKETANRLKNNVIDTILSLPQHSELNPVLEHINWQAIGLLGHSLGGIISVQASQELANKEISIKAVINMDGPQIFWDENAHFSLPAPTCFLQSGETTMGKYTISNIDINNLWIAYANNKGCIVNIKTAHHNNFTGLGYVTPLKWLGMLGSVDGKQMAEWNNEFVVSFFNSTLKQKPEELPMRPFVSIKVKR